jgi:glycosyltransferase involved in cell wall biosynthesis
MSSSTSIERMPYAVASGSIRISAVMPCLNEDRTIGVCIDKAFAALRGMGISGEVVVADNGSSDRSIEIATARGARVIHVEQRGYGAALMAGIEAARGEYVIIADSDDSYDWLGIAPFVVALEQGNDLVVGNRFAGGIDPGAMPTLHRYVGNPVLSWLARIVHRAPIGDFHCGMRAFRRDAFQRMNLRTSGMEFATEMIVNSAKTGLKIGEVPIRLRRDGRNRPPHLRAFRDGWRHLRFILTYGPNYLYLAPGVSCFIMGSLMLGLLARGPITLMGHYIGIHFLALACGLTLVGFNLVHYGIMAKVVGLRSVTHVNSRIARWAMSHYSLERTLLVASLLVLAGLGSDAWLLVKWLAAPGAPMDSTVHSVFIATLAIVIGVNLALGAFLLNMLIDEAKHSAS